MSSGVIARTIVLDRRVKQYLEEHRGAVVVNIACGLGYQMLSDGGIYALVQSGSAGDHGGARRVDSREWNYFADSHVCHGTTGAAKISGPRKPPDTGNS